jgi:hypothetical protein
LRHLEPDDFGRGQAKLHFKLTRPFPDDVIIIRNMGFCNWKMIEAQIICLIAAHSSSLWWTNEQKTELEPRRELMGIAAD